MGKHRHEYARTHARTHTRSHTHTHTHTHTRDSGAHNTRCSLHPKTECTLRLSLPSQSSPKPPISTTQLELHRHIQAPLSQTLASYSPITATHHDLPRGHPLPHPRTRWCACTQESQSHTQTLTHMLNQNSSGLTYGYQHTLRTVTLAHRYCSTSRNSESTAPTPITLSPHTSTPGLGNTHIHTQNSHSLLGPWVARPVLRGREDKAQGGLTQNGKVYKNRGNRTLFPTWLLSLLTRLSPAFRNEERSRPEWSSEEAPGEEMVAWWQQAPEASLLPRALPPPLLTTSSPRSGAAAAHSLATCCVSPGLWETSLSLQLSNRAPECQAWLQEVGEGEGDETLTSSPSPCQGPVITVRPEEKWGQPWPSQRCPNKPPGQES